MRIKRCEPSSWEVVGEWRAEIFEDDHIYWNNDPKSPTKIPNRIVFNGYSQIDVWQKSIKHLKKTLQNGCKVHSEQMGRWYLPEVEHYWTSVWWCSRLERKNRVKRQKIHSELIYSAYLWSFRGEMRMDNWNINYSWQHITGKTLNGSLGLIGTKKRF